MMDCDFLKLVKHRQSVRRFTSRKVEPDKLERCLEAARLAPSASNSQPWTFVVVNEEKRLEQVAACTWNRILTFNKFVSAAAGLVVFVLESPKMITQFGGYIRKRDFPLIDIGIAAEHFCLQATNEGLGTCMIGWFDEKSVKKLLNIPVKKRIGLIVALGYESENYRLREKIRKEFEQVVRYNNYKSSI